jgi:hypothetical protein
MNSKFIFVLASVCAVFSLIIFGESFWAAHTQKQILTSITSVDAKKSHDEMPSIELTGQSEESYNDLVTRPLFIKGRKPVAEPSPEDAQAQNVAVVKPFDWQLSGVYTTKKGLSALFSRSTSKVAKDNHRRIGVGADLDGWKLDKILEDRAVLKQGSQQKELLLRKIKPKDPSKKSNVPNMPNNPQPGLQPQPEPEPEMQPEMQPDMIPEPEPAEGEFENNNE